MVKDTVKTDSGGDVEFVKCECCGLTEECTAAYIASVRGNYDGRWICGLCVEAVKDEMERSCSKSPEEEALDRHMRFCKSFRSEMRNPAEDLISAVKQLLIRSLDSPRAGSGQPENSDCPRLSSGSMVRSKAGRFGFHD
ncbi:uncharacterized protein LOC143555513 [Bidens hawaiensis]|uniref:uncharacterized protein LOC143555513 n=1 Tax=Bidens hawaiensis TaxID=980011 RepID=UPI0040498A03